jgi:hypothetical protein
MRVLILYPNEMDQPKLVVATLSTSPSLTAPGNTYGSWQPVKVGWLALALQIVVVNVGQEEYFVFLTVAVHSNDFFTTVERRTHRIRCHLSGSLSLRNTAGQNVLPL